MRISIPLSRKHGNLTYCVKMPCLAAFMLVFPDTATHVYATIPELGIKTKVNLVSKDNLG